MPTPEKFVFVVGAPRSGTTWLQLPLSQHPDVASCQETHIFSSYMQSLFQSELRFASDERGVGLSRVVDEEDFVRLYKEFALSAVDQITRNHTNGHGKIFVEKTPAHVHYYQNILRLFPEAFFIEIVRDPRAMVASMRAVDFGNWTTSGVIQNCHRWKKSIRDGLSLEAGASHHRRVKYEDLLHDTERVLSELFEFIGEKPDRSDISVWAENVSLSKLRSGGGPENVPWDMNREPQNFYRKGDAVGWKKELSKADASLIERLVSSEMDELGYEKPDQGQRGVGRIIVYSIITKIGDFLESLGRTLRWYRSKL